MNTKQSTRQGTTQKTRHETRATSHQRKYQGKSRRFRTGIKMAVGIGVAVVLLGVIYFLNAGNGSPESTGSWSPHSIWVRPKVNDLLCQVGCSSHLAS